MRVVAAGEEVVAASVGGGQEIGIFGESAGFGEAGVVLQAGCGAVVSSNGFAKQFDGDIVVATVEEVEAEDVGDFRIGFGYGERGAFSGDA